MDAVAYVGVAPFTPGYPIDDRSESQRLDAARSILGDVERYAARIVARLTGEQVTLQDDNRQAAMPDIRIDYADGRRGYVEVAADIDGQYAEMMSLLRKQGDGLPRKLSAPELDRVWYVTLSGRAKLNRLDRHVRELLAALAAADMACEVVHGRQDLALNSNPNVRALHRLGVVQLSSRPVKQEGDAKESGQIWMYPAGISGPAEVDWAAFVDWINELVTYKQFEDKCKKLRGVEADERHLFVGTSYTTSWAGFIPLTFDCTSVPEVSPTLPEGITHVWIFNIQSPERCLVWSDQHGWRDTMKHWSTE